MICLYLGDFAAVSVEFRGLKSYGEEILPEWTFCCYSRFRKCVQVIYRLSSGADMIWLLIGVV